MRAVAVVLLLTPHCVHAVGPAVDLNVPYAHSVDPRKAAHLARIRRNAHVACRGRTKGVETVPVHVPLAGDDAQRPMLPTETHAAVRVPV